MPVLTNTERTVFSGYNIATTGYIYNANASAGINDGWQTARSDEIVVQMGCATLTDTSVNFRVEGRLANGGRNASLYVTTISVANSMDKMIRISEKINEIRVGARLTTVESSPLASPHNIYCGIGFTDYRW